MNRFNMLPQVTFLFCSEFTEIAIIISIFNTILCFTCNSIFLSRWLWNIFIIANLDIIWIIVTIFNDFTCIILNILIEFPANVHYFTFIGLYVFINVCLIWQTAIFILNRLKFIDVHFIQFQIFNFQFLCNLKQVYNLILLKIGLSKVHELKYRLHFSVWYSPKINQWIAICWISL